MPDQKKTLIQLTKENPVLGLIYGFCIVVSVLAGVVFNLYSAQREDYQRLIAEKNKIQQEKETEKALCDERMRESNSYLITRIDAANSEIIALYERFNEMNRKVSAVSTKNSRLAKQNDVKLKQLEQHEN